MMKRINERLPSITDREAHEIILGWIHPYSKKIPSRHRTRLINRIRKVVNMLLSTNQDLRSQVSKIEQGELGPATMQSINNTCERLIKEHRDQRRLSSF